MRSAVARGRETELTALPSIGEDRWVSWVRDADVLLVDGGDATSLCHWLRASGLAALLPSLPELVWVGVSAGSMVLTPRIGDHFVEWSNAPDDRILGIVDFSIFPHLDYPGWPGNTLARRGSGSARSTARRTPSTTRQRSPSSTTSSPWSPRATGRSCRRGSVLGTADALSVLSVSA
jgi:dipeptidase E